MIRKDKLELSAEDYHYELPDEKIAKYALGDRSDSKLLVYNKGSITHSKFSKILNFVPDGSMLVFNNTKVIQARLNFLKKTGARIEVFCLEPNDINGQIDELLNKRYSAVWKCMVGNKRKWREDEILDLHKIINKERITLKCKLVGKGEKDFIIEFNWNEDLSFTEILLNFGTVPIPPYLDRDAESSDLKQYQTVYAQRNGAVAAPTAGLHFTPELLTEIPNKGLKVEEITLHVSAGTFQPIKEKKLLDHPMHSEQIVFSQTNIKNLINHSRKLISVGTTSLRALESLYWFSVMIKDPTKEVNFTVDKLVPYKNLNKKGLPSRKAALEIVLDYMKIQNIDTLVGNTSIFLFPGYKFKMCDGLITNYHMPKSTLILLVAAFVGDDWRRIYNEAMNNDYRFLSYGDSSLILPS